MSERQLGSEMAAQLLSWPTGTLPAPDVFPARRQTRSGWLRAGQGLCTGSFHLTGRPHVCPTPGLASSHRAVTNSWAAVMGLCLPAPERELRPFSSLLVRTGSHVPVRGGWDCGSGILGFACDSVGSKGHVLPVNWLTGYPQCTLRSFCYLGVQPRLTAETFTHSSGVLPCARCSTSFRWRISLDFMKVNLQLWEGLT